MKNTKTFGAVVVGALMVFSGCAKVSSNGAVATGPGPCDINPLAPTCIGACSVDIYQPGCAGWGICGADPYADGCAGYCQINPFANGCSSFGTIGTYPNGNPSFGTLPNGNTSTGALPTNVGQGTKDTSLQQAELQTASLQDRAARLSNQFGMNLSAAVQLTQLADRMNEATSNGHITDEDRAAITDAALGVAGITAEDTNAAAVALIQNGDHTAVDTLMVKAAANLGMSSPAALRDQILPALGINIR